MNYIPHSPNEKIELLKGANASCIEDLFSTIPSNIKQASQFTLPKPLSELELIEELSQLSSKNISISKYTSFLGGGTYHHFIPSAIKHIVGRSEFYTAYTPYQAEISQGMLQVIFEYQSLICRLTNMDVANASLYDGATALAEAISSAVRSTGKNTALVSRLVNPNCRKVLKSYSQACGWKIIEFDYNKEGNSSLPLSGNKDLAAIVIQQPNFFGCIEDLSDYASFAKSHQALFIVMADPISLGLLKPPGDFGADLVVGEGQSLGSPPCFGGPSLGFFASSQKLLRFIPGRLIGKTEDANNATGYVLTMQAREQHIRREKAGSNICTNSALMALAATAYLSLMGKTGLRKVANLCLNKSNYLKERVGGVDGFEVVYSAPSFKEFVVKCPAPVNDINQALLKNNIIGGIDLEPFYPELKNHMLICVTELISKEKMDQFIKTVSKV